MTKILFACLSVALFLPATAFGQALDGVTITGSPLSVPSSPGGSTTWNIEDCRELVDKLDDELEFEWEFTLPDEDLLYSVKLDAPGSDCTANDLSADPGCTSITTSETLADKVTAEFSLRQLFGGVFSSTDACSVESNGGNFDVLLIYQEVDDQGEVESTPTSNKLTFTVNLDRPEIPIDVSVVAGESTLEVRWAEVTGVSGYTVFYSDSEEDVLIEEPESITADSVDVSSGSTTSVQISDRVSVNTTYYVSVSARSSDGNLSHVSAAVSDTTAPTLDFWEIYQATGGQEVGGCATGRGGFSWLALGLVGLALGRRRRMAGTVVLAACLAVPATASAELTLVEETPIHGAFELKLGRYNPAIDDEFSNGENPYRDRFGDRNPIYLEMEYDVQFWRGFGSLGVFGALGWHQVKGDALRTDRVDSTVDTTRVRTLPLRLGLVYRFDELHRRWSVPLAFSLKAGLDYYVWSIRDSNGVASADVDGESTRGRGATAGYHLSIGAHFLLDFLAPQMASTFDLNSGVNNTYLFAELTMASVNDFGSSKSWDLSDTSALFGIAFEF